MTAVLPAKDLVARLSGIFPGKLEEAGRDAVLVGADALLEVAAYLRNTAGFAFDYFNMVTAVDYYSYFELVYHLTSTRHNHSVFLKVRCYDRANPSVPSVAPLWQGADFQEREVFDLFGIRFEGHPNLKRIVLWEGFDGYPLRKDWNR